MSEENLQSFWSSINSDSPSGANLEYDARFLEMMRHSEGTREQQYGDTIVSAQQPDWRSAKQQAMALMGETRDL
ncbi:MAG: type VI secretion system ImpA family N-terminal domain-containing protein, partial [Planctomycetota bacterium]